MSEHSRSSGTFKNYTIALGLVVAVLLVMALVVAGRSGEAIPTVEYRPDAEALNEVADHPVVIPSEELPEGWIPTSSTLDLSGPVEWSVGFATPEDSHAMLSQSDDDRIVAGRVRGAEYVGTVNVGDRGWEHYDNGDDWRALVDEGEGMTVVLSGPTTLDEFAVLAESLQALPEEEGEADDESDDEGDEEGDEEDSDDA